MTDDDYNNWPVGVIDFEEKNPLWRRVWICLRYRRKWADTEFRYFTVLHGSSSTAYSEWEAGPSTQGERLSSFSDSRDERGT